MSAMARSNPLRDPQQYNERFKVQIYIHEPCGLIFPDVTGVGREMLGLCFLLDLLIKSEVIQMQNQRNGSSDESPSESETFRKEAGQVIKKMKTTLQFLPKPVPELEDYLDSQGLSLFFPRVEVFLIHGHPIEMLEKPAIDGHFEHICKLNQLLVLSQLLQDHVQDNNQHKYIALCIALLYRALQQFPDSILLNSYCRDIEANFSTINSSLQQEANSTAKPVLPEEHVSWLCKMTGGLLRTVRSLPYELSDGLSPAIAAVLPFSDHSGAFSRRADAK
uniref:uncharacterized protein n=1 Tax=Myxine glutinosa TaxID=7769 RepID=UPI00358F8351